MKPLTAPLRFGVGCHELGPGWQPNPPEPLAEQPLSTGPVDALVHRLARQLVTARRRYGDEHAVTEAVATALYWRQRLVCQRRGVVDG